MSFEDKNDSNNDNFFNITVRVTDPTSDSTDSTTYDELDIGGEADRQKRTTCNYR